MGETLVVRMSTGKLSAIGFALAVTFLVLGWAVINTRVTFGAGSLPCGTALDPAAASEAGHECVQAGRERMRETAIIGAVLIGAALLPLALHRLLYRRRVVWLAMASALVAIWVIGLPLGFVMITRAYSAS